VTERQGGLARLLTSPEYKGTWEYRKCNELSITRMGGVWRGGGGERGEEGGGVVMGLVCLAP